MAEERALSERHVDSVLPEGKRKMEARFYMRNRVVRDHLEKKRSLEYNIKMVRREVDSEDVHAI
jgi:hypothetical protein